MTLVTFLFIFLKVDEATGIEWKGVKVSHLNMVDLAGSERASQTGSEGIRFKEGIGICMLCFIIYNF